MTLTTQTTLALAALALGLGWFLGGTSGAGVFSGFAAAATVAGVALLLQRRIAAARPAYLLPAVLGGLLLKACALLGLTALVRLCAPLAALADWFAFALSFGATTLVILVPATLETLQQLQARTLRAGEGRPA